MAREAREVSGRDALVGGSVGPLAPPRPQPWNASENETRALFRPQIDRLLAGGAGAIVLTEEVFESPGFEGLVRALQSQPPWSDVGVLLFAGSEGHTASPRTIEVLDRLPNGMIVDGYGVSETGGMAYGARTRDARPAGFSPGAGATVISEDRSRVLDPGDDEGGWTARQGRVPPRHPNHPKAGHPRGRAGARALSFGDTNPGPVASLGRHAPDPEVELHPDTAVARAIAEGLAADVVIGRLAPAFGAGGTTLIGRERAGKVETAKKLAPTRPHPGAPNNQLFHKLAGPGVGMVDRLRDRLAGRATG